MIRDRIGLLDNVELRFIPQWLEKESLLTLIVGCLCPDFDYAIKFAATIITLFVLTSGYLIQYQSQQVWLRWIFYINALGLGFAALMENEFGRLSLECTGESLVPSGPGYTSVSNQVCTLPGSVAGTLNIAGGDYITQGVS